MGRSRSRSRSRSPDGGRRRRSRERRRRRDRSSERKRSRERSRSPIHSSRDRIFSEESRGDLAWDREREKLKRKEKQKEAPKFTGGKSFTLTELEGKTEDEVEMMKLMGFTNFDTTKNKKVDGNDQGAVHVSVKRKYRQYMNRKGGFNRPLDYVH